MTYFTPLILYCIFYRPSNQPHFTLHVHRLKPYNSHQIGSGGHAKHKHWLYTRDSDREPLVGIINKSGHRIPPSSLVFKPTGTGWWYSLALIAFTAMEGSCEQETVLSHGAGSDITPCHWVTDNQQRMTAAQVFIASVEIGFWGEKKRWCCHCCAMQWVVDHTWDSCWILICPWHE